MATTHHAESPSPTSITINLLPTEVILHIFTLTLPPSLLLDTAGRRQLQTLRCICSSWRTLCFSTKVLWSGLYLNLSARVYTTRMASVRGNYARRVEGWFVRAGAAPASPSSHIGYGRHRAVSAPPSSDDSGPTLQLVLKLRFHSIPAEEKTHLARFIQSNRSRWSELMIAATIEVIHQIFQVTRLRRPTPLTSHLPQQQQLADTATWKTLTSLRLTRVHIPLVQLGPETDRWFVESLARMPVLRELGVADLFSKSSNKNWDLAVPDSAPPPVVKLPQLRHLDITINAASFAVFPMVLLENLTHLTLSAGLPSAASILDIVAEGGPFPDLQALTVNVRQLSEIEGQEDGAQVVRAVRGIVAQAGAARESVKVMVKGCGIDTLMRAERTT